MHGHDGDDLIGGGDGNDVITGEGGADLINGGDGDDTLRGGAGADGLSGWTGDDVLNGNSGRDTLVGGTGDDRLFGGNDRDTILGEDGNDFIKGQSAEDVLSGGTGDDKGIDFAVASMGNLPIEIDEKAEISNSTDRSRSGSESLGIPELFGVPQKVDKNLPEGASLGDAVSITGGSSASGDGSVRRNGKLTLRVAATVVEQLPNGILAISGTQEVRVNFELRELLVTGYVRPEDISRTNEITYDKIASIAINSGAWEVCTDPNYRGHCEVISRSVGETGYYRLNDNITSIRPARRGYGPRPGYNRPY